MAVPTSDLPLSGAVALITGGSRGIGRATATALTNVGARVVELSRSGSAIVTERGSWIDHVACDVGDRNSIHEAVAHVLEVYSHIDVLINNAGIRGERARLWELDPEDFERALSINLMGPFLTMRDVIPSMIDRRSGVIINVTSGAAERPRPRRSMYGTSKAALDHLTLSLATEVAEFGIRVHAFHPGPVNTALFNASAQDPKNTPEELAAVEARFRAGEVQRPEEPGAALAWLATPSGALHTDTVVAWSNPKRRAEIRTMAGLE